MRLLLTSMEALMQKAGRRPNETSADEHGGSNAESRQEAEKAFCLFRIHEW